MILLLNFYKTRPTFSRFFLDKMLCACSGEQFKFDEPPQSPESLATRDFSVNGLSSRTGDWESKLEDTQVDEAESTLKEALSLNYEVGLFSLLIYCYFSCPVLSVLNFD